jgi:hypothetical protein
MVTYPDTQIDWRTMRMHRRPKSGSDHDDLFLNCLAWTEDDRRFVHCLELDLLADGATESEAVAALAELIIGQVRLAEEEHIELFHPAPREYWEKLYQIHMNHVKQSLLDHPPRRADEFKLSRPQTVYA